MGAIRWSEFEDAVLRGISERGEHLVDQMHRLPGRTYMGSAKHAQTLGIRFGAKKWSKREHAILRRIYKSDESIKTAVGRLLPGRTYSMAKAEARILGITGAAGPRRGGYGYSAIFRGIERLLAEGRMESIAGIAAELKVQVRSVNFAITKQHGARVYVAGWRRTSSGQFERLWALGAGPDMTKPPRRTPSELCRGYRARLRIRKGAIDPFAGLMTSPQQVSA